MIPEEDEKLEEDTFVEKVPHRYAQFLEEDSFEKIKSKQKDWDL